MSVNKVEGLLNEVESIFEDLSSALQEISTLETQPTQASELINVIDNLMAIQHWIQYRKNALNSERDRLADQIIAKELSLYEAQGRSSKRKVTHKKKIFEDFS